MKYRVELRAITEKVVTVEADSEDTAWELAADEAYDSIDEVDRASWKVTKVAPVGAK
ncbi:hypothetical protein EV383_4453 [Pseudonocardia sediminis]|uniref:DpnD/PcfM-like protein n=1 Tax=Pseudonocardia sediminis TaxID=1397368 RepID=A0A4Q7V239_PSEST|nr:hypothetical protein [Pseudonocardia sediminis]RZT87528.1 hypothetical protein EV383_4453 [Pseudonocardia sediminis]